MAPFQRRRKLGTFAPSTITSKANALTAAGMRVNRGQGETLRRLVQPWQTRSFFYYDALGEIKYAAQFYSRSLASLELYAAEIVTTPEGRKEIVATDNPDALAQLDRIQDPGGGRSSLLATYGRLMFLVGECILFVSQNEDTGAEQWEMLSTDELRIQSGVYLRYRAPSLAASEYKEPDPNDFEPVDDRTAVAYRLWRRHPRFSMLSDATMQGVLELCEELILLTQAVRARARSRLAGSGVLFVSDAFSPNPSEPVPDEDPMEDPFLRDLTDAMTAPIADEGTASAVVPLVVRGPTDAIEKGVKHVQIIDPTQLYPETGLRRECIERIAIGLDMPPEILLGLGGTNHWASWAVDEQVWKSHLQPLAQQLVDDLTSSFFRPSLRELGVADWDKYVIAYDATSIINHPDRGKDAQDLYNARAISKQAYREAKGFDEDDAPEQDELHEMIGVAVRDGSLALFGIPSVKSGGIEPRPGEIESGKGTSSTPPGSGETGANVEKGPPASGADDPLPETVLGSNGAAAWRIVGASDVALHRAREMAGNRIRNAAKRRNPDLLDLLGGVRANDVAATLGHDRVRALGLSEQELVAGTGGMISDAFRVFGVDPDAASRLVVMIEKHAASTLYEATPRPLPKTFTNYVQGLAVE